jgi:hypothetical protein
MGPICTRQYQARELGWIDLRRLQIEFLARAGIAAADKARELGWIV